MKVNNADKISLAQDNLKRVSSWIGHADQKIGISLVFQAGLAGFIATSKTDDIKAIIDQRFDLLHFTLYVSLILFIFFIARGAYYSFKALYPDIKAREASLFFFGSITTNGIAKFKKEFSSLTEEETEDDLNNQVFINSQIANAKFTHIKTSIFCTGLATLFWIVSLILIAYLNK